MEYALPVLLMLVLVGMLTREGRSRPRGGGYQPTKKRDTRPPKRTRMHDNERKDDD